MELIERQAVLSKIATVAGTQNKLGFNIIKKESKAIKTINVIRTEFGVKWVNKRSIICHIKPQNCIYV